MGDAEDTGRAAGALAWRATPVAVVIVGGLLLLPWIGRVPLLDADEPRFAECARQMLVTGDWVYPQFNGRPRHAKPPLFNWLQASAYACLGVSEFTARLPSVLATIGTGLLVFFFTRRLRDRALATVALVTWFVLPQTHLWGRMSVVDPLLTFLTTAALMAAYVGLETEGRGALKWYVGSGLAMGLATLTKGPVGIVVPGGAYLLYVLTSRSFRKGLGGIGTYLALVIAVAVPAPWFMAQINHYGHEYTSTFFGFDNVQRYTKARDTLGPLGWLWPIPVVLLFAFPTSVLLPRALKTPLKDIRRAWAGDARARWRLFLAAWVIADAALFAPSATRLPQYFLALYPAAAMLVADLLMREAFEGAASLRRSLWVVGGLVVCGGVLGAGFAYGALNAPSLAPKGNLDNVPLIATISWVLGGAFVCGGVACAGAWLRARGWRLVAPILGASLLVGLIVGDVAWPAVGLTRDQGLRELGLACREQMRPDAPIIDYGLHTSTVVFYSRRLVLEAPKREPRLAVSLVAEHPGARLITHQRLWPNLPGGKLTVVGRARQYVLAEAAGKSGTE
jgi:4-amino-4-deoxy-L-arabinose transferase-like glycosyltransferase